MEPVLDLSANPSNEEYWGDSDYTHCRKHLSGMSDVCQWLYDHPFMEVRLYYHDAAGHVLPEARPSIIRGTFGSTFTVRIFDQEHKCVASADGPRIEMALRQAMERAGDAGSWVKEPPCTR